MPNSYTASGSVSTVTASIAHIGESGGPAHGHTEESTVSAFEVTRRLLGYLRPYALLCVCTLVAAVFSVVLQLYIPILIGEGIDLMVDAGRVDFTGLMPLLRQMAGIIIGAALTQWVQGYCTAKLSYQVVRDLRVCASEKISHLPLSFIDAHSHGDLMSRVVNDTDQVGDGLLQGITQLFSGVVTIVGTLVFMLSVSAQMACVVVLVTPLSIVAAWLIANLSNKSFETQQYIQGQLGGHVEEYVGNQRLVSAFAYGSRAQEGFDALNAKLYVAGEHAQWVSSLSNPGTRFINNIIYIVVAVIGCLCVITGWPSALTVGGVQIFLSYANQYTKPFNEVTSVVPQIQVAYASAKRIFALFDADEEAPDAPTAVELAAPQGALSFEHVSFSYRADQTLLQDICFEAAAGSRIALVGPTGCGKTTLINLLMRFYEIHDGTISLDGHDTQEITRASLRHGFGMVLQDAWLFEGTVAENIAYGKPDATAHEICMAARAAHADGFIAALPQGYETFVGQEGTSLSQGQCQLLNIARVMLANPAILLLDEATSSVDTRTEMQLQEAFDELMRGRTSLVAAHRLSTVIGADCILVMREGRIVERGTHAELLEKRGAYAELYNAQFAM